MMPATAQPNPDTPRQYALALANIGLRALPIRPGQKQPPMKSWQHAATDDPDKINNWYDGLYREAGVGLAMGPQPNGDYLFAIDVDTHDPDKDGIESLNDLETEHGKLPDTWRSLTGNHGIHIILRAPPDSNIRNQQSSGNRVAPGIDVRGDGGQIVVAPTVHPDTGNTYEWEDSYAPWQTPIADAPQWLLALVLEREQPTPPPSDPFTTPSSGSDSIAEDVRNWWDWNHELTTRGWTQHHTDGNDTYWVRPGKDRKQGHSAVQHGNTHIVVFTTDIPASWTRAGVRTTDGSAWSFSPFGFYAATEHDGNRSQAAKTLRQTHTDISTDPEHAPETEDESLLALLIKWPEWWAQDHGDAEWIAEPIIPAGRSVALFAPGGTGKSLLSLWICAKLATGIDPFTGNPQTPINVLYLDYEMTNDDLAERLSQMGFDGVNMTHLHYALLPSLPGLDKPEGGKAVCRLAALVEATLVVIDTFGRAVHGDENDADTVRSWYRWTGIHLKHDGRAFLRVDHAGKDIAKGQRGTSAKNDDVDVVWQMTVKDDHTFALITKKRRMGWVPETVKLELDDDDVMRFNLLGDADVYPPGTSDMATILDDLDIEKTASARVAQQAVRQAGHKARNEVIRAAQKYRRSRSSTFHFVSDAPPTDSDNSVPHKSGHTSIKPEPGTPSGTPNPKPTNPHVNDLGHTSGHTGAHPPDVSGAQCVPNKGAHVPNVPVDPYSDANLFADLPPKGTP